MKRFFTSIAIILVFFSAHGQTYDWVRGGGTSAYLSSGGYDAEAAYYMCTDPHGNVYALHVVGNSAVYADTFYHAGGSWSPASILFTSHDCNGQMRFAKLITGAWPIGQGIVADSFGNIYMAADLPHNVSGTTILRMGYDTVITANPYLHQALVKYDTSGRLQWVRFVGNNTLISSNGTGGYENKVVLDSSQYPHLILNNYSGVVFRPGDTSIRGATDLKYDPIGNLLTVKHISLDSTLIIKGAAIDPQTNKLYAYGYRWTSAFPTLSLYSFLAAFDTNRNQIRIDTLINPGSASYSFTGLAADGLGHLYVSAAGYGGTTIFRTDTARNALSGSIGALLSFVMKTDTASNVKWMTTLSAQNSGSGLSNLILSPDKRKIAIVGSVLNKTKCDIDSITSFVGELQNPVFSVLDTAGYVHELQQMHGAGANDRIISSAFDRVGSLYVGGRVDNNVWGGTLTPYTSVGGESDYFITKYGVDCNCTSMPAADFTYSGTRTVTFAYTGTTAPAVDSIRWYFGDGATSTSFTPVHVYTAPGTFTVRCRVYTACGRDLKGKKIVIPCTYPGGAAFTHSGVFAKSFTYTGSLTDVDSIRWKFGDGGTSPLVNPSHTYATPGTYNACVKVYSWCGVDSFCTSIVVPCVASPAASLLVTGGGPARTFSYTGTTTAVSSYTWDYGDMSAPGSGPSTTHTYAAPGVYTVCVTATNPCGTNTYCTTINVTCMATPVAAMFKTGSLATRNFAYTGTTAGIDSIGWYFGDGGHVLSPAPTHMYGSIGTFTACAIAYSQCGTDTVCDTVFVPCLAPATATFTASGITTDSTRNFTYTGTTTGVDSVRWNFGDGSGFTGTTATHTYHVSDTYTVCAVAYSACGNDTVCSTVVYHSTVGLGSPAAGRITLYPNPATGSFTIQNAAGMDMRILDLYGRELTGRHIGTTAAEVYLHGIAAGTYIVELTGNGPERVFIRIVKQ